MVAVDVTGLGSWGRVSGDEVRMRESPSGRAAVLDNLPDEAPVRFLGGAGQWYRVLLTDGRSGFIHSEFAELPEPDGTRLTSQ